MSDKEKDMQEEEKVVCFEDEDGNEYYYQEEMIIPVGDQKYALLVGIHDDEHEHGCGCGCGGEDDEDVIIAKIIKGDDGEDEYVEPTDEEFEAVEKAYNALVDEAEKE